MYWLLIYFNKLTYKLSSQKLIHMSLPLSNKIHNNFGIQRNIKTFRIMHTKLLFLKFLSQLQCDQYQVH
jgi:hypothetical protein